VKWIPGFLLAFCAASAWAQEASDIDRLLAQSEVSWGDACVWSFASHGEPYNERDAVFYAISFKALPANAPFDANANLAGLALILMRVYQLKGGIFYSIFKNRRYAFREMIYIGVFDEDDDPSDSFSGEKFLQILSRMSAIK
jgi:hypothetical protein